MDCESAPFSGDTQYQAVDDQAEPEIEDQTQVHVIPMMARKKRE